MDRKLKFNHYPVAKYTAVQSLSICEIEKLHIIHTKASYYPKKITGLTKIHNISEKTCGIAEKKVIVLFVGAWALITAYCYSNI